jgi:BirA family biotin operon repressor/biotin-[acetyl-CoA-carboxylase] ligase
MSRQAHDNEPLACAVYRLLCDRRFHSGTDLARRCGVTRGAIWKAVSALRMLGVSVEAVANRGYRLPAATPLLQAEKIVASLPPDVAARVRSGDSCWSTGSTNTDLLQRAVVSPGRFDFMTAEYQSAGRGRRTRRWLAPPGAALCLSLSWNFPALPPEIGALSLAIGVCALRALQRLGYQQVSLKWPNDLVIGAGKLGGILTELRAESSGPALTVIGIGINVALGSEVRAAVRASGTEPIDLAALPRLPGNTAGEPSDPLDRNYLAAALLGACVAGLLHFEREGFRPFLSEWRAADALAGKAVLVQQDDTAIVGHARGIDAGGALCVQTRSGLQRFITGEVSVRAAA